MDNRATELHSSLVNLKHVSDRLEKADGRLEHVLKGMLRFRRSCVACFRNGMAGLENGMFKGRGAVALVS